MGTSLNGLTPAGTYPGLIKTGDNAPIDGTLKTLSDGNGNNLPMSVSTTTINLTGTAQVGGVAIANTTQVNAKQDTLVSGTNIKTINGTSVLGSGDIVTPTTNPSGVAGAIQFTNGSAFASDAANLFWDDTNKRLGVGTNAPTEKLNIVDVDNTYSFKVSGASGSLRVKGYISATYGTLLESKINAGTLMPMTFSASHILLLDGGVSINTTSNTAKLQIKGSGSTSATTSLLVQNSAGAAALTVRDDLVATFAASVNALNYNATGNLYCDGQVQLSGNFRLSAAGGGNGIGTLLGAGSDGWNRLNLGGTTSSFPSIKRDLNNIEIRNADGTFGAGFSVGATLNATAILQADSTTKGFLPPRMTTTQKNAIATPATGLVVYDSTTNKLQCYNGSTWNDLF